MQRKCKQGAACQTIDPNSHRHALPRHRQTIGVLHCRHRREHSSHAFRPIFRHHASSFPIRTSEAPHRPAAGAEVVERLDAMLCSDRKCENGGCLRLPFHHPQKSCSCRIQRATESQEINARSILTAHFTPKRRISVHCSTTVTKPNLNNSLDHAWLHCVELLKPEEKGRPEKRAVYIRKRNPSHSCSLSHYKSFSGFVSSTLQVRHEEGARTTRKCHVNPNSYTLYILLNAIFATAKLISSSPRRARA